MSSDEVKKYVKRQEDLDAQARQTSVFAGGPPGANPSVQSLASLDAFMRAARETKASDDDQLKDIGDRAEKVGKKYMGREIEWNVRAMEYLDEDPDLAKLYGNDFQGAINFTPQYKRMVAEEEFRNRLFNKAAPDMKAAANSLEKRYNEKFKGIRGMA